MNWQTIVLVFATACSPELEPEFLDGDGDGFDAQADCDDTDPEVNPDAVDTLMPGDADCDGFDRLQTHIDDFAHSIEFPPADELRDVAICDLDADGNDDLILLRRLVNGRMRLEIFDGPIRDPRALPTPLSLDVDLGRSASAIDCGQWDGVDGNDLVATLSAPHTGFGVYLNPGTAGSGGTSAVGADERLGTPGEVSNVGFADLDGDGIDEMVYCLSSSAGFDVQLSPGRWRADPESHQIRVPGASSCDANIKDYGGEGRARLAVHRDGELTFWDHTLIDDLENGTTPQPVATRPWPIRYSASGTFDGEPALFTMSDVGFIGAIPFSEVGGPGIGTLGVFEDGVGLVSAFTTVGDWNDDGTSEIFVVHTVDRVRQRVISGADFGRVPDDDATLLDINGPQFAFDERTARGDLDGDGRTDVVHAFHDIGDGTPFSRAVFFLSSPMGID